MTHSRAKDAFGKTYATPLCDIKDIKAQSWSFPANIIHKPIFKVMKIIFFLGIYVGTFILTEIKKNWK